MSLSITSFTLHLCRSLGRGSPPLDIHCVEIAVFGVVADAKETLEYPPNVVADVFPFASTNVYASLL
jgi:hypothetical protein